MKRSKLNIRPSSPTSSTPSCGRHGAEISSLFNEYHRDLESEDGTAHPHFLESPVLARHRFCPIPISPLRTEHETGSKSSLPSCSPIDLSTSFDIPTEPVNCSDLSIIKAPLSEHLRHSLSYARNLEKRASFLSSRMIHSTNLSHSANISDHVLESRRRSSVVDDLNLHSLMSISQQTNSNVERYARLATLCPDVSNQSSLNRFVTPCTPGEPSFNESNRVLNPFFNCTNLAGSFSNISSLSRTRLAVLYRGKHRLTGLIYCLKRSRCEFEVEKYNGRTTSEVLNEVQALSIIQHPNIVRYYSSWFESDSIFTQLEYCIGGSLFQFLYPDRELDTSEVIPSYSPTLALYFGENDRHSSPEDTQVNQLTEESLVVLTAHTLAALSYLHSNWSMVHGDVKPSNILIQLGQCEVILASEKSGVELDAKRYCHKMLLSGKTDGLVFKLCDFGRSSRAGEDRDGEDLGDGRYLPSLNDPGALDVAAKGRDLYALGVTIYHAAGGQLSVSVCERMRVGDFPDDLDKIPESLLTIAKTLLRPTAQERSTAVELLGSEIFRPYSNVYAYNTSTQS